MWKKILPIGLVLVTLLSFTACGEELPSAQEIIDGAIESADDIKSHKFDMDMSLEAAGEEEDEAVEIALVMGFSGAMDIENKEMSADINISMEMTGEDEMDMEMAMEMYLVDDVAYVMMDMPEQDPTWMKEEEAGEDWEEVTEMLTPIESHLGLLETADVSVIGSEKVEGVDCYVLQLTPDMEQLWETAMQQTEVAGMGMPAVAEEALQEALTNFSVKQWIAKDTYFLTKSEIDMSIEMIPELMDIMGGEGMMTMDITVSFLSYDHNQPISIEVPPEALEATGLSIIGEAEAAQTEFANVQSAVIALMVDNGLSTLPNPVAVATNDMGAFPDTSVCGVDKAQDRNGNAYVSGKDKDGYVLYQHDINGDATSTDLVNYVAVQYTQGTYTVDSTGTVTQVTTRYE